jgi:hypothetical protein
VDDGNLHFLVHPFLFRLISSDNPKIRLNWENVSAEVGAPLGAPSGVLLPESARPPSGTESQCYNLSRSRQMVDFTLKATIIRP